MHCSNTMNCSQGVKMSIHRSVILHSPPIPKPGGPRPEPDVPFPPDQSPIEPVKDPNPVIPEQFPRK